MNNTSIGNKTEKSASSILRSHGYWVYNCPKGPSGKQPVDLIAIKNKNSYVVWLMDSKHVEEGKVSFVFDRVEDNQRVSLMYANEFAGIKIENMGFVIKFDRTEEFYWLPYRTFLEMEENGRKSVNLKELELFEKELEKYE